MTEDEEWPLPRNLFEVWALVCSWHNCQFEPRSWREDRRAARHAAYHRYAKEKLKEWEREGLEVTDDDREAIMDAMARVMEKEAEARDAALRQGLLALGYPPEPEEWDPPPQPLP